MGTRFIAAEEAGADTTSKIEDAPPGLMERMKVEFAAAGDFMKRIRA
jgi:hypothetical protein